MRSLVPMELRFFGLWLSLQAKPAAKEFEGPEMLGCSVPSATKPYTENPKSITSAVVTEQKHIKRNASRTVSSISFGSTNLVSQECIGDRGVSTQY